MTGVQTCALPISLKEIRKAAQGDVAQEVRLLAAWILHDFGEVDAYREVMAAIQKEGITTKSHYETTLKLVKVE